MRPAARPRPRLHAVLDRDVPVTVLHGPAGAGKTTLAAHWTAAARAGGERVAWYDGVRPDTLAGATVVVVDHADRLPEEELLGLVDDVRRSAGVRVVLALRAGPVARIAAEVETRVVGPGELALDAGELRDVTGGVVPPDTLAWTGGHVGTVVGGLSPGPAGVGWSRERARVALAGRLDGREAGRTGLGLLPVLGAAPVPTLLVGRLLAGPEPGDDLGETLAALQRVVGIEVVDEGLRFLVSPALREVLRERYPVSALAPDVLEPLVRHRWWQLLREDPALLGELLDALPDDPDRAGPVAAALRDGSHLDRPNDLAAATVRVHAARRRGDLGRAEGAVHRGELLAPADPGTVHRFAVEAGLVALESGALARARHWWLRAHGTPGADGSAAALLALLAAVEGDRDGLGWWRDRAGRDRSSAAALAAAVAALDDGDHRAAAGRLAAAAIGPDDDLWYLAAAVRAGLALHTSDRAEAVQVLRADRSLRSRIAPLGPMAACVLDGAEADLLLADGRATEAAAVVARLPDQGPGRLRRGRLALLTGDLATAYGDLAAAGHSSTTTRRVRLEALLLLAEVHRRAGRADDARDVEALLAARGPWPRLADLRPGGPVYPASGEVVQPTARERALLALLRQSTPRDRMAASLFVSTNTVKTQLQGLYRKLGVTTREEAVTRAFVLGLLD